MNDTIQNITGVMAGALTTLASLPQLIKCYRTSKSKDLSINTIIILLTGVSLWTIYGLFIKDFLIIIFNATSLVINMLLLILKVNSKNQ